MKGVKIVLSLLFLLAFVQSAAAEISRFHVGTGCSDCADPYIRTADSAGVQLKAGWLTLESGDLSAVLAITEVDSCFSFPDPAGTVKRCEDVGSGYAAAGRFHTSPGVCDQFKEAADWRGYDTTIGWVSLCSQSDAA